MSGINVHVAVGLTIFVSLLVYAIYTGYRIRRGLRNAQIRGARYMRSDAAAYVRLHAHGASEDLRSLYIKLAENIESLPLG